MKNYPSGNEKMKTAEHNLKWYFDLLTFYRSGLNFFPYIHILEYIGIINGVSDELRQNGDKRCGGKIGQNPNRL